MITRVFFNSEDLLDPELPFKKSRAKGGSMVIWKKWMDPYVTPYLNHNSSGFQAVILSLPNCQVSIHVAVYLPTSGKDQEFTSQLTDLSATLAQLAETYPDAPMYLRGDFNVNSNNSTRVIQLESFKRNFNFFAVKIAHKTYHHFVGHGNQDSSIDLLLYTANAFNGEQLLKVLCKYKEPEINSHHDLIISSCEMPRKAEIFESPQNLHPAPRITIDRAKVLWTDEGRSEYETLVSQNARSLCDFWYDPSSPALTTVLLNATNSLYNMAASKTNKIVKAKNKAARMVSVPSSIKRAKDKLRKAHSKLCYIRANPSCSASALDTAERKYHNLNMNYKNVVRKNRARSAIVRD